MDSPADSRSRLISDLFPAGVPRLWCPPLTHYADDGAIDFERMAAHLQYMGPWVKGYLMPGTTGDGWELSGAETMDVVRFALAEARKHDFTLLLGVLRKEAPAMRETLQDMMKVLEGAAGQRTTREPLKTAHVAGFTVCPPSGENLTQQQIEEGLSLMLGAGVPIALYQLPQVTGNEVAPETFERLARRFPNLIFFKDTSGNDRVALSGIDKGGVFLTRGAEGNYVRWLKSGGGPYDGFLLSTANSFPSQLKSIVDEAAAGSLAAATEISARVTEAFDATFGLVQSVPVGNAFTNANKAIDHYSAFGPSAGKKPGPMLHGGLRIGPEIIAATGDILRRLGLMPGRGYLE